MADLPSKAELGAALARVLGAGGVSLPLAPATDEERRAAQAELEFRAGMRLTRQEPDPKLDADHERRMVEHSIQALRARADHEEAEGLGAEAERLRAIAARHEAGLKVRERGKP